MQYSTLREERKLWKQGYRFVACIDEVGRGPLAGPVVACAVVILPKPGLGRRPKPGLGCVRDSKKLSPKRRKEIYNKVKKHPAIQWGIGLVSPRVIDRINIYRATQLAMKKALMNLQNKLRKNHYITKSCYSNKRLYINYLILDGNMGLELPIPQTSVVKADEKVFSCALASIIAKVTRDRMMVRYHKKYPQYGFDRHKGYGTPEHIRALRHYGPCFIHRKTFNPVANILNVKAQMSNAETI